MYPYVEFAESELGISPASENGREGLLLGSVAGLL